MNQKLEDRLSGWRENKIYGVFTAIWGMATVALCAISIMLGAIFMGGNRAFRRFTDLWVRQLFAICDIQLLIEGWEALPESILSGKQSTIFMSTHESNMDPPVLIRTIQVPAVYISKKELLWVPLVGWVAWLAGVIFIDRSNRERARASLHQAAQKIHNGKTVVIFPEGTRTRTGELGTFKKGGFALAMDAGVPIVPMATVGGYKILPAGGHHIRPGRYVVLFGNPVDPGEFKNREELLEAVRTSIVALREKALGML
jgi:1-acyl-sn-glycerol-3-phosphate acyltransferase